MLDNAGHKLHVTDFVIAVVVVVTTNIAIHFGSWNTTKEMSSKSTHTHKNRHISVSLIFRYIEKAEVIWFVVNLCGFCQHGKQNYRM